MKYLSLLVALFIVSSCTHKTERSSARGTKVAEWPNLVMYEIFVQSFADSDGDGIGDIRGMTSKLDYLEDLGIGGIWLMPIMPSPSYHKYDVTDYYEIHHDYGTMADFKNFLNEAHKRDIQVVIDMIINHTSNQHPWFLDSKGGVNCLYREYFVWMTEEEINQFSSVEKEKTGDSYNITQWHDAEGNDEKYYGFFTGMMPDLNFDNPKVRDEVIGIARYWIEEIGVDGLRLDAARHIYEDSRVDDNQNWWIEYRAELQKINPNIYLVGEVWEKAENIAPFLHGLPALFNFDLSFSILESVKRGQSVSAYIDGHSWTVDESMAFETGYLKNQQIYLEQTPDFDDAIFLSNHDQNRVLSVLGGNLEKGKLAAAILLTMPGTPYIYYGEEIGMLGMKPDPNIREPFLWNTEANDTIRTKWMDPEYTSDNSVVPLAHQLDDENSIFHHYRRIIDLRNRSKALSFGGLKNAHYGTNELISYFRIHEDEQLLVIHNLSDLTASVQLKQKDQTFTEVFFCTEGEEFDAGGFDMSPYSTVILQSNQP
jgi:alpha-amylase